MMNLLAAVEIFFFILIAVGVGFYFYLKKKSRDNREQASSLPGLSPDFIPHFFSGFNYQNVNPFIIQN